MKIPYIQFYIIRCHAFNHFETPLTQSSDLSDYSLINRPKLYLDILLAKCHRSATVRSGHYEEPLK